jgi:hypothetical protein
MTSVAYGLAFPATRGMLAFHASGFDPTMLFAGDTGGWWDPSDSATMWQDTSATTPAGVDDPVARIDDKSGNGNHLLQASASARPLLRNSGALWWLEFDGVDDFLQASFTLAQPLTRISAAQQVSWTSGERLWDGYTDNGAICYQLFTSPTIALFAGTDAAPSSNAMTTGANHVVTEIFDGSSSVLAIDNNSDHTGNPGAADPGGATIGTRGSATSAFGDILWFGAIWIGRVLSGPEIAQARSYFGAKAGLSL